MLATGSATGSGWRIAGTLAAGLAAGPVNAAPPPDAGQLMQQMEKGSLPPLPSREAPAPVPLPAPMTDIQGPTLAVRAFRFTGNTQIDAAGLAAAVAGYLNRPLDLAGLQLAAAAAAERYREAGWVVRAFLPEQDVVDGVVTIQIVEAVFGGVTLDGPPPARIDAGRVRGTIGRALADGDLVDTNRLDRALLLLGDLPGLSVQGALRPGRDERETALALRTQDRPLSSGTVGLDNFGAASTGSRRGTGALFLNSPFGLGDQAAISAIASAGNRYGRLAWSLPVGYDGWRVGVSASYLTYRLTESRFRDLQAVGSSASAGVNASWPVIRTRTANLYLGLTYDHRTFDNRALHATVSHYGIDAATAGFNGNLFDDLGGRKGVNTATLTVSHGRVGPGHPDFGDAAPESAVRFSKLRYALAREQQITEDLSAYAALSGQLSSRNLDSSEKFYPGGPDGVRAYPVDETGGGRGTMANVELRWRLPENLSAAAFYDRAHLKIGHGRATALQANGYSLSSAGLSLAWQADFGLIVRGQWARRIGKDPNPTDTGGNLRRDRVWLSATQPF